MEKRTQTSTPIMKKKHRAFSLIELMIALSLGILLCIGIFNLFSTMQKLHQQQIILSHTQEKMRFISQFLRETIQDAGNWSCLSQTHAPKSITIRRYNSDNALSKLGLTIKSGTDLLEIHECIRLHDKYKYLPINFFIANTFRVDQQQKEIDALFFKIAHHHREELITAMTDFQVCLYHMSHVKKNIRAVKINYELSSVVNDSFSQSGVLYGAVRKTA